MNAGQAADRSSRLTPVQDLRCGSKETKDWPSMQSRLVVHKSRQVLTIN